MFSAGEIAKSIHAVAQCIQTIRSGNSAADEEAAKAPPGLVGGSSSLGTSGISSLLSQPAANNNVSVVSSSMDFFGAPESSLLPSHSHDAEEALPPPNLHRTGSLGSSRKAASLKSDEPETTTQHPALSPSKRIRLDDDAPSEGKPFSVQTLPTMRSVVAPPPPSFEQVAIVAALEHLYGKGAAGGVQKHLAETLASSGKFAEANRTPSSQLLPEASSPSPLSLPPKKFQHISRALLGTSTNSSSFRGGGGGLGPRPSMPPTFGPARPLGTTEASKVPPPESSKKMPPSAAGNASGAMTLPKKAPYLDAKPSAAKQSKISKKAPDGDDDDEDEEGPEFEYNDSKFYSSKSPMVLQPSAYDVLLGRGKSNKNHPGNKRFQDCIQANRERYFNALTNVAKRDITMEILQFIRQKGRFLRRGAHGWVDVPTPDIQQKVAHALQYRRRCVIKEKTGVVRPPRAPTPPLAFPKTPMIGGRGASIPPPGGGLSNNNNTTLDPNLLSLALSSNIASRLQAARNNDYELASAENAIAKHKQQIRDMEYYQSHLGQLLRSTGSKFMEQKDAEDEDQQQQVEEYVKQLQQQQFTTSAVQQYLLQNARPAMSHRGPSLPEANLARLAPAPASLPRELSQAPPPPSDNLDSSGLHSLADVISRIYSQDQKDITMARGCHGA